MPSLPNPFNTLSLLPGEKDRYFYSLPTLAKQGFPNISSLPVCIRIILESLLRNCDGKKVKEEDIRKLANWSSKGPYNEEIPFVVSRVILQDFTGVPLLVDLAAMRDAVKGQGFDPSRVEPQVPVDLVIDHSVQVDRSRTDDAFMFNLQVEFERNRERYTFLKWGQQAFHTFKVVPSGIGIVHQVNLEHIATVVSSLEENGMTVFFPDTLVGTDSHTTMINGLGVLGWGVGGIEAEAAMLGQPVFMLMPEVIGVHMKGSLKEGVTATDLTLRITEMLRQEKVVGKLVEFFGEGAASLSVADRATIGNMSPEYGATAGFFPPDEKTLDYLRLTGREESDIKQIKTYLEAQQLFGIPREGEIKYTKVLQLDLSSIVPSVAGPKRPQDLIPVPDLKTKFSKLLSTPIPEGGYGKPEEKPPKICVHAGGAFSITSEHETGGTPDLEVPDFPEDGPRPWSEAEMVTNRPFTSAVGDPGYAPDTPTSSKACEMMLSHGSVVIAAITSCTNTSNPSVMIGAGLLAKKAVEKGLKVNSLIKTSLAPGSRVVTDYLEKSGLQPYLDKLGFQLVAYGCTTCIGNSGPLEERIENAIKEYDLITASVLSGNRNFEARIHGSVKANFLMSPPLVVAFAIAGRVDIDLSKDPLGYDANGEPVMLYEIWPTEEEVAETVQKAIKPEMFRKRYAKILSDNPIWEEIETPSGAQYEWDEESTYIQNPPYFADFTKEMPSLPTFQEMRPLALFGDSVTTDHISPAGAIRASVPAGKYLLSLGIEEKDFNSYGSRRGNHEVMMRGTFANVRIRNLMLGDKEGGYTKLMPEGALMSIYDACQAYAERNVPLILFAGKDYGMGSSRDWAAKGTALLGVKVVVAKSFERIHRSNLIGMGVLPLQFLNDEGWDTLKLTGEETFSLKGLEGGLKPGQEITLEIKRNGKVSTTKLLSRLDSPIELDYYTHGGILPFMLRHLLPS